LDFYDLKGVVEALLADLHVSGVHFRPVKEPFLHPGKATEVVVNEGPSVLATLGELHPKVAEAFGLAGRAVQVAEIYLGVLQPALPARYAYRPISTYPVALRDVAVVVAEDVPAERVEGEIWAAGGTMLRGVRLFDLYRGESIPAGHKSLAYALS